MISRINKWFSQFKKYFFYYKDGFWELPCLFNSPDVMIETLGKMPFNKHDKVAQTISSDNPFTKGIIHYQEIETGFWIQVIDLTFKANVNFNLIYDDKPTDYYSAGYYVQKNDFSAPTPTMNGDKYYNKSFTFNKPGVGIDASYYKGTSGLFICLYFDKNWFENNILNNPNLVSENLKNIINGAKGTIIWPDLVVETNNVHETIFEVIQEKDTKGALNTLQLKNLSVELLASLFTRIAKIDLEKHNSHLSAYDRKCILNAEKILIDNLFTAFPGIENISAEIGISPTKLKLNFKHFFGQTLFEYYQKKQMNFAKLKLQNEKIKIKDLAAILGYENASKFAVTFKKHFAILPSELK